jgi:hypothetical protein
VFPAYDIMCPVIAGGDLADIDYTKRLQDMLTRAEGS